MMTNSDIEQKAYQLIAKYNKKGGSYKLLLEIMEDEHIKFKEVTSTNCNFVGVLTYANTGQCYVMVNAGIDNVGRKNFTIAHELGHYFLQHELKSLPIYCSNIEEESISKNPLEAQADFFASCFLMPEDKIRSAFLSILLHSRLAKKAMVKDFLNVKNDFTFGIWCGLRDDLMKRYGVSEAALRYRLYQLNLAKFEFIK